MSACGRASCAGASAGCASPGPSRRPGGAHQPRPVLWVLGRSDREEAAEPLPAGNVDLKAVNEDFYRQVCGGGLEAVKETLRYVCSETSVWVEITNLLIPGLNDSDAELHEMTSWIADELGIDVPVQLRGR